MARGPVGHTQTLLGAQLLNLDVTGLPKQLLPDRFKPHKVGKGRFQVLGHRLVRAQVALWNGLQAGAPLAQRRQAVFGLRKLLLDGFFVPMLCLL